MAACYSAEPEMPQRTREISNVCISRENLTEQKLRKQHAWSEAKVGARSRDVDLVGISELAIHRHREAATRLRAVG